MNANFHFSHYKFMESLSCHSNKSTWAMTIKNIIYVEAKAKKKKVVFTVTCLEKNGSVGRDFFFFFFFFFFATQTAEMHLLAVIMLHQHKFCVYKGKRKLKLLITCENFVLFLCFNNFYFAL